MKNVCKYRYNVDIDDFFVSNFSIVSNSLYSSELKYVYVPVSYTHLDCHYGSPFFLAGNRRKTDRTAHK